MTNESISILETQCKNLLDIYSSYVPCDGVKKFDLQKVRDCITQMAQSIIENKTECEAFLLWMDNNEFYKTPASTRFHGNWEGGLCVHSLLVSVQALTFAPAFAKNFVQSPYAPQFDFSAEDIFVSAIAHDFCKAASYKVEFHNTKDIFGNWVKKSVYKVKPELRSLGHGNESVLLLLESMPSYLKKRHVIEAISRHMGFSDLTDTEKLNYSNFLQNPLVLLIQTADQSAAAWWDC